MLVSLILPVGNFFIFTLDLTLTLQLRWQKKRVCRDLSVLSSISIESSDFVLNIHGGFRLCKSVQFFKRILKLKYANEMKDNENKGR